MRTVRIRFEVIAEIESSELFGDENANWRYCNEHEDFQHREACEFLLHVPETDEEIDYRLNEMARLGCTDDFISAYREAAAAGAQRVLFYA